MQTKLQKSLDPDTPKELTRPRTLDECRLFRLITESWHAEDNSHRPLVPVYPPIDSGGPFGDEQTIGATGEAIMRPVEFGGLVESPLTNECKTIDDCRPFGKWRPAPYILDGETVFIARCDQSPNVLADQTERFQMILQTHCHCEAGELEPFVAQSVAENLATMWGTWGALDFELGISLGSMLIAADACGIRIHAENNGFLQNMRLERRLGKSLRGVVLMMKKKWLDDPEAFSVID